MKNNIKAISADNKLAFYLDKDNIHNQELVSATISHFETVRHNIFKPLEFLNLLRKQCDFVLQNPERPKEVFKKLKALPLTAEQKHILYFFIIWWFGGVGNLSHKRTLRLIENEFKVFKGNTPEKVLYFKDISKFYQLTFNQIRKLKTKFDKLTYPEKLKFWEDNIIIDFHYSSSSIGFYLESDSEIEDEGISPEKSMTIFPKGKLETEQHNRWLYNLVFRDKENRHCDYEVLKEKYYETLNNNPLPIEFTELEIEAIKKQRDREKAKMEQNQSMTFWGYYFGYQSVVKGKEYYVELSADKFKRIVLSYVKGVADAHYLGFLETQLTLLKQGKSVLPPQGQQQKEAIQSKDTENHLPSSIEELLFPFKDNMSKRDYDCLSKALEVYFSNGKFPVMERKILITGKINKRKLGWALTQIFRKNKEANTPLPYDYLLYAKQNISLFADSKFNKKDWKKSNLYNYFTTKKQ